MFIFLHGFFGINFEGFFNTALKNDLPYWVFWSPPLQFCTWDVCLICLPKFHPWKALEKEQAGRHRALAIKRWAGGWLGVESSKENGLEVQPWEQQHFNGPWSCGVHEIPWGRVGEWQESLGQLPKELSNLEGRWRINRGKWNEWAERIRQK